MVDGQAVDLPEFDSPQLSMRHPDSSGRDPQARASRKPGIANLAAHLEANATRERIGFLPCS